MESAPTHNLPSFVILSAARSAKSKNLRTDHDAKVIPGAKNPVAVPGIFVADGAASSSADRCHCDSLRAAFGGCSLAWRLRAHIVRSLYPPQAALPSLPFDSLRSLRMTGFRDGKPAPYKALSIINS